MGAGANPFPLYAGAAPPITSLLIKPASAVCNLDCAYCFYLDRDADPYKELPARRMTFETLERLVDTYLFYSFPHLPFSFPGAPPYKDPPARRMPFETLERLVDTYLFYSFPNSTFAFQGGEPTLAGLDFFEQLIRFQQQYGRNGQNVSNSMQTNAVLLDDNWAKLFKQ